MKTASRYLVLLIVMLFNFFATDGLFGQTWESLSGNVGSITIASNATKYYRLTGDVAMTGNFSVSGKLTLDLNGYVLKRSNHMNYLIGVLRGGECTVIDSNPNTSHYGKPATIHVYDDDFDYLWEYDASYTASTPGAIEIKGGIITGGIGQTGGAFYVHGTLNLEGGTIAGNFIYCGPFKVKEGQGTQAAWVTKIQHPWKFEGQHADYDFNKVINLGTASGGCYIDMDNSVTPAVATGFVNIKGSGGGVWVGPDGTFNMSGGRICYNYAALHGGGVYTSGHFNMTGGLIDHNYALGGYGAGVFIARTKEYEPNISDGLAPDGVMTMDGGEISSNTTWGGSGGGIMAWKGKGTTILTIENGTFQNNQSLGQRAVGLGNGGAIYGEACDMIIKNINVHGNYSGNYGGGIYLWAEAELAMNQGICNITGNSSKMGGGGICLRHSACSATLGSGVLIEGNTSVTEHGGGFSMKGTSLTIDGAIIRNNHAAQNGGGVYVDINTTINLIGNTEITNNSADGLGGGVYFENSSSLTVGTGTMNIRNNTVAGLPNNIYLLKLDGTNNPKTIAVASGATFNPKYLGVYTENRTPNIPVFTGTSTQLTDIFNGMASGELHIYDDSQKFNPINPNGGTTLYFGDTPWSPLQQKVTGDDLSLVNGVYQIGNVKQLTAFLWLVNNIDTHANLNSNAQPTAKGKLTADIDMTGHYWVPIGEVNASWSNSPYSGIFDGNGHTITGITMVPTNASAGRGLFGTTATGADIKNITLDDCQFFAPSSGACYVGSVVSDLAAGTVSNSIANTGVSLSASGNTSAILGGIAGRVSGGTLHSSVATAEMTGYQMGGLVGQLSGGNLYNSFANAKFANGGSGYVGGLVGVNAGTVENCYAREQAGGSHGSDFGYLVGDNTNGTIQYSYAPSATYTASGKTGIQTGLGTFTATTANAYDYKAHDNQVSATNNSHVPTIANKQLVKTLDNWVEQDAVHKATYARWLRPTTQAINGDYPLLRLPAFNAVAATDGDAALDYGDINEHLANYKAADQAICLYGSRENVDTNVGIGTNTPLYIDQDAVITQTGDIQAYVGVTLDNSAGINGANPSFGGSDAIDWHFFSSALADAPIGLEYGDNKPYEAYDYPSWQAHFTNANGYFQTNLDNYYDEWDLYAYCEPDYHWINLKRNSASHWHEDYPGINIPYTNDTEFVPGKGYMVALKEEGYLQAYGTLNNNTGSDYISVPVTCTSSIGWTTREGHNLLGNPYQSYLDFDAFARENSSLWNTSRTPFYIIMDEDNKDYVLYTIGQSPNPLQASRFMHPHQGFMIDCDVSSAAKFDNSMRTTTTTVTTSGSSVTWDGGFRGGEDAPCYPLVNLMATDANGNRDIVTVELGRPDKGGALKQDAMHSGKGSMWCRYEGEDYALVFTQPGLDAANIRFATDEDAEFTMTWSTHNGEFSYLHLIDNLTGADIDCLTASEYGFSARKTDYNSRFRLVFDYTGIDDHEVPEPVEGPATFAYYANGEIHLTDAQADASLQIIDMTGRIIVSRDGVHTVSTTGMAAGVYVLRLTDRNGTRIQKIVLE